jgi:hypothetical protein
MRVVVVETGERLLDGESVGFEMLSRRERRMEGEMMVGTAWRVGEVVW